MRKTLSRRNFLKTGLALLLSSTSLSSIFANENKPKENPVEFRLNNYVEALIKIESNENPKAERYETHLDDYSYGLGQILTATAKDIEKRHPSLPRLGKTKEEIRRNLLNPEINRTYTTTLFREELDFYRDPCIAVAAYNSGHSTPRNARCQEQLNDLYKTKLVTDGIMGRNTKEIVKRFQRDYGLRVDGILGTKTYLKLQEAWQKKFPDKSNPIGIVPINKNTLNHVLKFKLVLEHKVKD